MIFSVLTTAESSEEANPQLYNSRILDCYIKLLKKRYKDVNINELLSCAKIKPYEIADQGHWFTQEQVDLFYKTIVQLTDNKNIAREAGRYAASPGSIGGVKQYCLGMVSPARVYEIIGKATAILVRSSTLESKKIASNKIEVTVTPRKGATEKPFQCENRIGFFEAISMLFSNKLPQIEHTECIFKNGNVCRYIISWEESSSAFWKKIRNYSVLFLFLACLVSVIFIPYITLTSMYSLKNSSDNLIEQININYNNSIMTNEIGQAISTKTDVQDILTNVIRILKKRLKYDRALIFLANPEKTRLIFRAEFGHTDDQIKLLQKTNLHLSKKSKEVFVVSFREQKPFLISDITEIERHFSPRSVELGEKLDAQSFICCPIISNKKSLGILAVDNVKSREPLVESDLSLLTGIASVIGISIRNSELLKARIRQFDSMIRVLAFSIDARDPLTAGHSEKVTEYTLGICDELGISKDYREMIRIAALLHDYGKIGVPDSILKKNGMLTEEEYEAVKSHARFLKLPDLTMKRLTEPVIQKDLKAKRFLSAPK
jgi:HD-GYP domain-containing protein (c-di-GMP phosphodiesterase class II)